MAEVMTFNGLYELIPPEIQCQIFVSVVYDELSTAQTTTAIPEKGRELTEQERKDNEEIL